jgi:hypothetical protein
MPTPQINKHYNFSVYANAVLGTSYTNTKLVSMLDYSTALKFANVALLHRQIFPYLPPGTPSDQTKYTYYLFQHNDKQIVLADLWILQDSLIETEGLNYTITLNNITSTELAVLRDQMRLLGLSFSIL